MDLPADYRKPTVKLIGTDGNCFAILGAVSRAMKQAGIPKETIDAFFAEATAGDYDHLLRVTMLSGAPDNMAYLDSPIIQRRSEPRCPASAPRRVRLPISSFATLDNAVITAIRESAER